MITEKKIFEKELQIAKQKAEDKIKQRKKETKNRRLEKIASERINALEKKKADREYAQLAPYRKEKEGVLIDLLASFSRDGDFENRDNRIPYRIHEILVKGKFRVIDVPKKYFEKVISYFSNTDNPERLYLAADLYASLGDKNKAYSLRYKARENAELQAIRDADDFERAWR
ncbi:MAG: hypothetical protein WCK29_03655 [archaeon]